MVNIILSAKPWHITMAQHLADSCDGTWIHLQDKSGFNPTILEKLQPDYIFIPHWSHLISKEIYENYNCIIFHMTDLPYGRGGSPLQNLIVAGHTHTKISAIQCSGGIDTGDVYLKRPLSLEGSAREIFERAAIVIENMIYCIVTENIVATPQEGDITNFRRRKKYQSNIEGVETLDKLYDLIRMLDCEGYPPAYLETDKLRLELTQATYSNQGLSAVVRICPK